MVGFIFTIVLLLFAIFTWAAFVSVKSEGNKFISLLPWWVLGYGVSFALMCPLAFFQSYRTAETIIFCIILIVSFVFACLVIACLIVCLKKKQYRNAVRTLGIGVLLIIYTIIVSTFAGMGEGMFDNFGKRHPIPEGLEYEETIGQDGWHHRSHSQQEWDSLVISRGLLLDGDGGEYRYLVNLPPMSEEGEIYLKMYEATTDFPLSEWNVKHNSTIHVIPSDSAVIYQMPVKQWSAYDNNGTYFKINEGSWGDYYAARAELWFQPDNGNEPRLLMSKIFRIEGFSR